MEKEGLVKLGIDDFLQAHHRYHWPRIIMKSPGEKIRKGDSCCYHCP
ncbi:MAG: hypothetical protein MZV63_58385 [Marinilabiliales bacterium]|nr:hypothetical protein [Marinilabiliales bacterium]